MDPRLAHPAAVRRRALPPAAVAALLALAAYRLTGGEADAGALLLRWLVLFAAFASLFTLIGYVRLYLRYRRR